MDLAKIFNRIIKTSLYLAIFLIPLFFLPFSQNVLEYPKQILLLFLVSIGMIFWLAKGMVEGKIYFKKNKLLYFPILFILFSFSFSIFFSLWPKASFWGWPLDLTDNFLTIFSFFLLTFLIANSFKKKEFFFLFLSLLLSATIATLFFLFQIFNHFLLPFPFAKTPSFNLIGNLNNLAIFISALLPFSFLLFFKIGKIFWRIIFGLISLTFLFGLVFINFKSAWLGLAFGILFLTIFGRGKFLWLVSLSFLLVLSIFFAFFPANLPFLPIPPIQVSPSFSSEIEILKKSFSSGIKNTLLGTGPGTFTFDYSKFRSPLLNQTIFWGTRFNSGYSFFFDWLLTKGILSTVGLLSLFFFIIFILVKAFLKANFEDYLGLKLAISASLFILIIVSFFYSFSFTPLFLFWLILGGFLFFFSQEKEINLSIFPPLLSFFQIFSILISISLLSLIFLQAQKYFAEFNYLKATEASQVGNIDQAIEKLEKATKLNPLADLYWRDLAQLYLSKADQVLQDPNLKTEEKSRLIYQTIIGGSSSINQAVSISPNNVANWNVRGFFYRNLIGVQGAGEFALESYRRAIELEPASPFAYGEMGRVYILMAQDFAKKEMAKAREEALSLAVRNLEEAIQLKSDYSPAHYLLAVVYDQQGKETEAVTKLEETKRIAPQDLGVVFQLGILYWRKGEIEKAKGEFERAISLNPNYSNARYMLGLVYDSLGQREKAKEQFERVFELNPQNIEVKKILENFEKGLPALEGITPALPPIQEVPPEIQK